MPYTSDPQESQKLGELASRLGIPEATPNAVLRAELGLLYRCVPAAGTAQMGEILVRSWISHGRQTGGPRPYEMLVTGFRNAARAQGCSGETRTSTMPLELLSEPRSVRIQRGLLVAGGVVATAAAVGFAWWFFSPPSPPAHGN